MNERIRELERQATETVKCGLNGTSTTEVINRKKFAELIVRECAEIGQQSVTRGIGMAISQHALPDYVKGKIQTHFGVKE